MIKFYIFYIMFFLNFSLASEKSKMQLIKLDLTGLSKEELNCYKSHEISPFFTIISLKDNGGVLIADAVLKEKNLEKKIAEINPIKIFFPIINLTSDEFIQKFYLGNPKVYNEFGFFLNGSLGIAGPYSFDNFCIIEDNKYILYHIRVYLKYQNNISSLAGYEIYSTSIPIDKIGVSQ